MLSFKDGDNIIKKDNNAAQIRIKGGSLTKRKVSGRVTITPLHPFHRGIFKLLEDTKWDHA